jgi:hypothetical protein
MLTLLNITGVLLLTPMIQSKKSEHISQSNNYFYESTTRDLRHDLTTNFGCLIHQFFVFFAGLKRRNCLQRDTEKACDSINPSIIFNGCRTMCHNISLPDPVPSTSSFPTTRSSIKSCVYSVVEVVLVRHRYIINSTEQSFLAS